MAIICVLLCLKIFEWWSDDPIDLVDGHITTMIKVLANNFEYGSLSACHEDLLRVGFNVENWLLEVVPLHLDGVLSSLI